ncbi:OPT family oligopeptide transporter [Steroidobacter cummioxidans]|uniref:OPT family oligopeptide transporter n=1 Tax=Steroidobacter cummioxidans TaxID=1803913 RepID=UPI000E31A90C|nr:oligopeptide transporter, OPT family [Steroidobacter cummioxidans]
MTTPATQSPPQLTPRAIILSIVLAMILVAANTYLGLFAGLTIATAIPAAVVSMAVLRAFGGGHILENNIVQTGASAGSSIAAGVIFTLPALVLLNYWDDFRYSWVLAIAGLGGLLGVLFSVPLRRSLIVEQKLAFPEGKAAAEVLKAGENPGPGIKLLGGASALGGLAKLLAASGLRVMPDSAAHASYAGSSIAYIGTNLSPALLGVGYIIGLNISIVIVAGGILSWNIAIPIYSALFLDGNPELSARLANADAETAAFAIWSSQIRYLGVGAMLVGGIWTLISLRHSLLSGVRSGLAAARAGAGALVAETERDLPMKAVLVGLVAFTIPLAALYQAIVNDFTVSLPMTLIMIVAGFLFSSVSAYMAGLVGSSNNPVSGITLGTILFASLVLTALLGSNAASLGPIAAIMIGAVVCCAAAIAGDNLQDLKCGYMVGATPWRQQVMLAIGALSCALIMAPLLNVLNEAYGIGPPTEAHPKSLLAPQATLIASVAKGLFGGELPWDLIWIGAAVGAAIIVLDEILKKRGSNFRTPVLAAAVGIYLPLDLTIPIFIGGILAHLVERAVAHPTNPDATERLHRGGVLFSAGLITGEALMGILLAIPIFVTKNADILALPEAWNFGELVGLAIFAVVGWILYRVAVKGATSSS